MIRVRHTGCTWTGSILAWERLPVSHVEWPDRTISVDAKVCPACRSYITCGSLEYEGETTADAAIVEIVASRPRETVCP